MHGNPVELEWYERVAVLRLAPDVSDGTADGAPLARLAGGIAAVADGIGERARVVVVTGVEAYASPTADDPERAAPGPAAALASLPVPSVAFVEGECVDHALELALACDLRVGGQDGRFGMRLVHQGVIPSDGGTQRLTRLVGRAHALRLLLTADVVGVQEARQLGLVEQVGGFSDAMALAQRIAAAAPIAAAYTKEAVVRGAELPMEAGLRLEADLSVLLQSTADREEGLRSFRERRPPRFEGR